MKIYTMLPRQFGDDRAAEAIELVWKVSYVNILSFSQMSVIPIAERPNILPLVK